MIQASGTESVERPRSFAASSDSSGGSWRRRHGSAASTPSAGQRRPGQRVECLPAARAAVPRLAASLARGERHPDRNADSQSAQSDPARPLTSGLPQARHRPSPRPGARAQQQPHKAARPHRLGEPKGRSERPLRPAPNSRNASARCAGSKSPIPPSQTPLCPSHAALEARPNSPHLSTDFAIRANPFSPEERLDTIDAALIEGAKRSIDFASYALTDPSSSMS